MEITIRSDMFGLSSTEHLRRNAVLHPNNDVVMMWWLCHFISQWGVGLNTSDLTQRSGLITCIASDLCQERQKYPCTVRNIQPTTSSCIKISAIPWSHCCLLSFVKDSSMGCHISPLKLWTSISLHALQLPKAILFAHAMACIAPRQKSPALPPPTLY